MRLPKILVSVCFMILISNSGCSTGEKLKTISSQDESVELTVPEEWVMSDKSMNGDEIVLGVTTEYEGKGAFIYKLPNEENKSLTAVISEIAKSQSKDGEVPTIKEKDVAGKNTKWCEFTSTDGSYFLAAIEIDETNFYLFIVGADEQLFDHDEMQKIFESLQIKN